ncbi:hypothetical protein DDZ14_12845 [Maritimibacter sp. 55A14]|uniref:hypothetical protein n=1 Tax=Maritimibacter sp. 55A14 TaxID=2174844 RepID=UPI000D60B4C5|nr:hypothetical protein [Maritimibacter sp. 55A14]PWE31396.1 hypothetical protein DDZ14_12845 [Maritimibacter sp. 55A14]
MNSDSAAKSILSELAPLLAAGTLPRAAQRFGESLAQRLASPVRVAVAGLPGSGKSQLLNMLAGRSVIADGAGLPSLRLRHGSSHRTLLSDRDGNETALDGIALDAPEASQAAGIVVEAPLPVLERMSLLEVVSGASGESQRRALEYGAARADIMIWCTQEFSLAERELWAQVPDRLKDHGFLALTKADLLHKRRQLAQQLADLEDVIDVEFFMIQPVATLQALAALEREGSVDDAALYASGGRALIDGVLKHVEQGRRADIDNAALLLRRYGGQTSKQLGSAPNPAADTPVTAPEPAPAAPPRAPAADRAPPETAEAAAPPPAPPVAEPSAGEAASPAPHAAAAALLRARAETLSRELEASEDDAFGAVLGQCTETMDEIADLFMEHEPEDAEPSPLHEDVMEASELMLLLRLEEGGEQAEDAITLLLQLRRDIETGLTA